MPRHSFVRRATFAAVLAAGSVRADAQQPLVDVSLDSLLNTRITAASKYAQTGDVAASSVTIVTSDDIRSFGYRNMQEVLESVRGFYVSNDRNYPSLGARGFSRSGRYNSRILLLIDGHATNDQVWGATPTGTDLPLNLDFIERIEIVQGPGSAVYGTAAMFAVINIVTKSALTLDGGIARVGIGALGERAIALAAGRTFGSQVSVAGSALLTHTRGADQYYAEFDDPATQNGIARGLDWEHGVSAYGTLAWKELTVRSGFRTRGKGNPTGSFGTVFGDSRSKTVDTGIWGDLAIEHAVSGTITVSGRLFADRISFRGIYPYDSGPSAFSTFGDGTGAGMELLLRWEPISRLRLTVGTEEKVVTRAAFSARAEDGTVTDDDAPSHIVSGFVQSELQLLPSALLVGGVRHDRYSTVGSATTPRLGLIFTPRNGTTVKLLYGEAFRAPSPAEALLTSGPYQDNPGLEPERIATTEIAVQQRLGGAFLLGLSGYRYEIDGLINEQLVSPDVVRFANVSYAEARGVELQLDARPVGPIAAQVTYAVQRTRDGQGITMTNSPRHVANLGATAHAASGLRGGARLRYESERRARASSTPSFLRTDTNVGYRPVTPGAAGWLGQTELSLRVTNLFDVAYASPTSSNNVQQAIAADGRTYALRLEWHF
jgi:outer membrane receptor protein involved in Fe transport